MDIVVLLKQVPDTEAVIRIADDGLSVKTNDAKWVVNPYDEYAVEEALRIKAEHGGTVTVICLGPEKAVEAIRTALAMGADNGVRVDDSEFIGSDALGTAKILAAAVKKFPHDLVICGQRALDDDNYQAGAAVAQYLDLPLLSMVIKVQINEKTITCHRTVEGGVIITQTPLPVLFTTQKGLNEPRFASMMGIMKAKKKIIQVMAASDLEIALSDVGPDQAKTKITALRFPPQRSGGTIISGDLPADQAKELVNILQNQAKVL